MKCSIVLHVFGKPLNEFFSKSEDPDEMQHSAACIRETPKQVLFQKVKIQMKCSIMLHIFLKPLNEYFSKNWRSRWNAACIWETPKRVCFQKWRSRWNVAQCCMYSGNPWMSTFPKLKIQIKSWRGILLWACPCVFPCVYVCIHSNKFKLRFLNFINRLLATCMHQCQWNCYKHVILCLSHDMKFPTMWYVRLAKSQISLIRAFASRLNILWWLSYWRNISSF